MSSELFVAGRSDGLRLAKATLEAKLYIPSTLNTDYLLIAGLPRQARQARFGPCLDFGFQYTLIRNNRSKKFGIEYWALPEKASKLL